MRKWGLHFDLENKGKKVNELEEKMAEPGFWEDLDRAQDIIEQVNNLKGSIKQVSDIEDLLEDLEILILLGEEDEDKGLWDEIKNKLSLVEKKVETLSLALLLNEKYDSYNAIVSLHPGAGGLESQDWVEILFRMYTRWAEEKGYLVDIIDLLPGDEAGIKSVTFSVKGNNAYGYLKAEKGVHRLVRISPFDTSGRRHTSFASLDVIPEVKDTPEFTINPEDLKIDTFRSKGAGGQHVNKTDSAVRITHLPTGLIVQCQNERSQYSNKDQALKILRGKLAAYYQELQDKNLDKIRGKQKEIAWGSQIRSYIFHPYSLVKDHRTGVEIGDVQSVMDGGIDILIDSYLKHRAAEREVI